jgi:hypothetical protein
MTFKNSSRAPLGRFLAVVAGLMVLASCGSSSNGVVTTPVASGSNVAGVEVDLGPDNNYVNGIFTSVEVCAPGSTSNCATVPNVLVDTGSSGLRLLSTALPSLSLPPINESGNALQECIQFVDLSYIWGPVAQADVHLAGETASSVPIQLISASPAYSVPLSCLSLGTSGAVDLNTVAALGANGILGVGNLPQDCGSICTSAANGVPNYYICPSGACQIASVLIADQLPNPVALFATDNNGVLISLPSVPATGASTATGSLIFGIGTQSNNALGSAQIYAVDGFDDFTTTYNGVQYSGSYIDSGSNILYFLDSATLGNLDCVDNPGIYCPTSTLNFTVTNTGTNGTSGQLTFSIANGDSLLSTGNTALNDLGGDSGTSPSTDYFDFGVPFFYGRNVFVGIAGRTVPNGASAPNGYWAY